MRVNETTDISPEWSDDQGVKYRIVRTTTQTALVEASHPDLSRQAFGREWIPLSRESQAEVLRQKEAQTPAGAQLFAIDITGIIVQPEPMGRGWQAHVEGDEGRWSRRDSVDEAVGSLIRRLAVESKGANWRRERG